MSPNVGENQRQVEAAPPPSNGERVAGELPEKSIINSPENSPQTQSVAASSQAASDMALPSHTVVAGLDDNVATIHPGGTSAQANDNDRIEKEWVNRAKSVVERTKDDPYEQKNEMSRVKADYIQKRFNKTVKADDPVVK